MKITADTKFNIGDTVYAAESYEVYWANKTPYIVIDITVNVNEDMTRIVYTINQDYIIDTVSEDFLFATYEECMKWCKEHN